MATRFYALNEATPYTPPSWRGSWDLDGTVTRAMDPHKFGSTSTTATRAEAVSTTPYKVGVLRLVSRRLAAQTINGTVDVVLGVSESNADADFYFRLHIYVVDASDGSVVGTLLNGYAESAGGGATEWTTTNTGRALQAAQAVSAVAVPGGGDYRIVAEIGVADYNSHTTSRTATIRYGARPITVGPAHSDLTAGSTSTSTLAGFLEFSGTVALASDVVPHLTPEDAFVIGPTLPDADTLTVDDAGYTYTVWGKFAGDAAVPVLGVFGFGDLTTYQPDVSLYAGVTAPLSIVSVGATNRPIQFATAAGTDYYLRFVPNSGNPTPAVLTVNAQAAPSLSLTGGIVVPDDTFPLAAILSSSSDYAVLGFRPFPPGEGGDVLPSGVMAMENIIDTTVDVYDANFALVAQIAITLQTSAGSVRANWTLDRFFAVSKTPNPDQVLAITPAGVIETTYTITGVNNIRAIAVSNDESILYYSTDPSGNTAAVNRWDLGAGSGLADLVDLGSGSAVWDILVLSDDTILALFVDFALGGIVRHYAADGTLLHTFDYADGDEAFPSGTPPRLARANDDPDSFWIWRHKVSTPGISAFLNVRIADGVVVTTRLSAEYETGAYQPAETATPLARFGNSFSCPFFVLPASCPTVQTDMPFNITKNGATFAGSLTGPFVTPQVVCTKVWFEWAENIADPPARTPLISLDPDFWPNPAFVLRFPRPRRSTTYWYRAATSICAGVVTTCPISYGEWVPLELPPLDDDEDGVIGPLAFVRWGRRQP